MEIAKQIGELVITPAVHRDDEFELQPSGCVEPRYRHPYLSANRVGIARLILSPPAIASDIMQTGNRFRLYSSSVQVTNLHRWVGCQLYKDKVGEDRNSRPCRNV